MDYKLITTDTALQQVCEQARTQSQIALDTEFVRTRTYYYPQLGLIQLYDGEQLSLIDPLPIKQWQPFIALLADTQVVKFLHAGSEDLEVFITAFKTLPTPMIDTQSWQLLLAEHCHVALQRCWRSTCRSSWIRTKCAPTGWRVH